MLQFKKVTPLGSAQEIPVDVRFICALKGNPHELIKSGNLLPDLFYRISSFHISLPPLRARGDDIEVLAGFFLEKYCEKYGKKKTLSKELLKSFRAHPFYGNIRELEMLIKKLVVVSSGEVVLPSDLPSDFKDSQSELLNEMDLIKIEKYFELQIKKVILKALDCSNQNISQAAALLNVQRTTLNSKMKKFGISEKSKEERRGLLDKLMNQLSNLKGVSASEGMKL